MINAEDDFTGMLAHQLIRLGYEVEVLPWSALSALDATDPATAELLLVGPGPGDPNDLSDPRILALHRLVKTRLAAAAPMLGICLGHQIISVELGLRVERLAVPDQGRQRLISLFGRAQRVGFYNSFVVHAPDQPAPGAHVSARLQVSMDEERRVQAVRGELVTGLQFHPESVLTTDGVQILGAELARLSRSANAREQRSRD